MEKIKTVGNFSYQMEFNKIYLIYIPGDKGGDKSDVRQLEIINTVENVRDIKYLFRSAISDAIKFERERKRIKKEGNIKQENLFNKKE